MSQMIERVARALAESHPGRDWVAMSQHGKDWWYTQARAAITSMREPTEAMEQAFVLQGTKRMNFKLQFAAAVDAALK